MSLPITAVGPLKVLTNPILIESAATAGFASARAVAPASQNAVLIFRSLLIIRFAASQMTCPVGERSALRCRTCVLGVTCFVREIAGQQQARTEGLALEPLAQCKCLCTIIRISRGWQEL